MCLSNISWKRESLNKQYSYLSNIGFPGKPMLEFMPSSIGDPRRPRSCAWISRQDSTLQAGFSSFRPTTQTWNGKFVTELFSGCARHSQAFADAGYYTAWPMTLSMARHVAFFVLQWLLQCILSCTDMGAELLWSGLVHHAPAGLEPG